MADENWYDNLKPDYKITRKLYHFPNRGTNIYNPLGEPIRIKSYEYETPKADPGYGNLSQCTVQAANFIKEDLSFDLNPIGFAFTNYLRLRPKLAGGNRTFHAFFKSYGSVVPVSSTTIVDSFKTGAEITGAISMGPAGAVGFLLGLVSPSYSAGSIDNQPFPSHHIGALKIEETLEGVVLEGGARDGRSGTYAAARVKSICLIYTDTYLKHLSTAWTQWLSFYEKRPDERQRYIRQLQGYLQQRDNYIKLKKSGDYRIMGMNFPNAHEGTYDIPWLLWAWERQLDITAPPADPRRAGYNPNFNYNKKRDWFRY